MNSKITSNSGDIQTLSATTTAHTANTDIHVTTDDKTKWNSVDDKLDTTAFTAYSAAAETVIGSKLATDDFNTYSGAVDTTIAGKVDTSAYTTDMAGKLNVSDFNIYSGNVNTAIGNKLEKSDFNTYSSTTENTINSKAESSALTQHTSDSAIHVTTTNKDNWNEAYNAKHSHSNKTVLDGIAASDITNWNNAYNKAHEHGNIAVISAITSTDVNTWNDVTAKTDNSTYTAYTASTAEAIGAKAANSDFTAHTANSTVHITSSERNAWDAKLDTSDVANFFDKVLYEDSGDTKVLNFYNGNTLKYTVDATDFITDGMLDNAEISAVTDSGTCLVLTFNIGTRRRTRT